jgi:hypothetical protein
VQLAVADVDKRRDVATQVEQSVQFDRCLCGAKRRPVEQTQAQIDGAGVERVDRAVQLDVERVVRIEFACAANQQGGQIEPDVPVARFVGIGQGRTLDWRAKAHRIELRGVGAQADFDVAQALAPCELRKGHRAKLLGTRQRANARVALVAPNDAREARPRHEFHDLSEQCLADVHLYSPEMSIRGKYVVLGKESSNRHQTKSGYRPRQCFISRLAHVI